MMATIEPRLMHLLNDSNKTTHSPPLDLPPIQNFPFAGNSHSLSLPPLDLDAGQRGDKSNPNKISLDARQLPYLYSLVNDEGAQRQPPAKENVYGEEGAGAAAARVKNPAHSLRLLLDDSSEPTDAPSSLRMILGDNADDVDDPSTKKRHRAMTAQLPQPLKKQKSSQQVLPRQQVMPPIINGLHEPPPNAAVFPPISYAEFDDNDPLNPGTLKDLSTVLHDAEPDKGSGKSKRRAPKPRRKWSEEETNHLLLGVSRHGVGKWTTILEDPDYVFNDRTAGDLKDRFRTCCPDELRGKLGKRESVQTSMGITPAPPKPPPENKLLQTKTSFTLENILIEEEEPPARDNKDDGSSAQQQQQQDSDSKPKKSRAHRKKMEDLAELGIRGPFKKSHRRERRPFTEQDDREILEGLDQYGPAWTKIQRDPRFHLSTRQPTDLRDRVRNKYPEIYARIEKANSDVKDGGRVLEPSVNTTLENSLTSTMSAPLEPSLNRASSREDMPKAWLLPSSLIDTSESHAFSRLLLDDSQPPSDP